MQAAEKCDLTGYGNFLYPAERKDGNNSQKEHASEGMCPMTDSRRFSRIPFRVKAELTVDDNIFTVSELINLSIGGCLLPITTDQQAGRSCQLKIFLEGSSEKLYVLIEGEIIRNSPEGMAVQFIRIDPESLFHLQNIIRFNAPDADAIDNELHRHPGLK